MEDPEQGLAELNNLARSGIGISIDDFGSGYSSLSYLKQLPATELKLDRSLIEDVETSESSRVIVETAVSMAHSLGYHLVAEGVENEQAARLLGELGCDRLQGFWFCRPLPLSELREWLV
jgi:EAL domain-containing protein (putative c-di-GMP-specific phosphodiesterase class I)